MSGAPAMDYPTAWAIQKEVGPELNHHPRCSSVPGWSPLSGPGLLCDCGAIGREYARRLDAPEGEPKRTIYYCRCGWCGAYEGTVNPDYPCATDETGYIGPHQFGIYERAETAEGEEDG